MSGCQNVSEIYKRKVIEFDLQKWGWVNPSHPLSIPVRLGHTSAVGLRMHLKAEDYS